MLKSNYRHGNHTIYWDLDQIAAENVKHLITDGKLYDKNLINRDTRIDNGIYVAHGTKEMIIVDMDNPALQRAYLSIKYKMSSNDLISNAKLVYDETNNIFKNSQNYEVNYFSKFVLNNKDKPHYLSDYVLNRIGNCRQKSLFAGAILEKMIDEGRLEGKVSMERNKIITDFGTKKSHSWIRLTLDEPYVIDTHLGYLGTLADSRNLFAWTYFRPEENNTLRLLHMKDKIIEIFKLAKIN